MSAISPADAAASAAPAQTVLAVDDDDASRGIIVHALRRAGLTVIEARSGPSAIEVLETEPVGVVVCDISMPGMTGIELVRRLRTRSETATLPVILITGAPDADAVIQGLDAGADDFLSKPIRLDELLARVRAHLRTQAAWISVVEDELRNRAGVVHALTSVSLSADPEETAERVVAELARGTGSDFVSVAQVTEGGRMQELATFNRSDGVRRGGVQFQTDLATYLLGRARGGPWVDEVRSTGPAEPTASLQSANLDLVASAPIFHGEDNLVGLLSIGVGADKTTSARARQAKLLAAAIDYASVLSAFAGSAIAGRREAAELRTKLDGVLADLAFHPVFQPIVEVETQTIVGFEALTRFSDGTRPDIRFAEAQRAEIGAAFELAALRLACRDSESLPPDLFLSLNISPRTVIEHADDLRAILEGTGRPIVLELTEHVPIDDYAEIRRALSGLRSDIRVAVDDAGAGYASFRHILELGPSLAKLDISLVRGIDGDNLRQGLAAGLNYFALRTGCRLIAEGVETQEEADTLLELGVEFAQGYLYGRPTRVSDMPNDDGSA